MTPEKTIIDPTICPACRQNASIVVISNRDGDDVAILVCATDGLWRVSEGKAVALKITQRGDVADLRDETITTIALLAGDVLGQALNRRRIMRYYDDRTASRPRRTR